MASTLCVPSRVAHGISQTKTQKIQTCVARWDIVFGKFPSISRMMKRTHALRIWQLNEIKVFPDVMFPPTSIFQMSHWKPVPGHRCGLPDGQMSVLSISRFFILQVIIPSLIWFFLKKSQCFGGDPFQLQSWTSSSLGRYFSLGNSDEMTSLSNWHRRNVKTQHNLFDVQCSSFGLWYEFRLGSD